MKELKTWFASSPFAYRRRKTRVVMVGSVAVGGDNPIRVQTMTTTDTMDTLKTVEQTLRCVEAGSEIVRITAPNLKDARNLANIKAELLKRGCKVPLVADIHFTPDAAMEAALHVEKVRVNPGNFADSKTFKIKEYSDEQYAGELKRIEDRFTPLVLRCKQLGRSMRIGTNHGSLSDRIMNRFGDTPLGMVESALEFVRIARKNDYHELILSMKSSNPKVMIQAYRLLAARMEEEGMDYPFHLGVTEAGEGEDGRIKSAVGIGALLEDGIGDTIRVSLTEDPELEIPVAFSLGARYPQQPASSRLFAGMESLASYWVEKHPSEGFSHRDGGACKLGSINLDSKSPVRVFCKAPFEAGDPESNLGWVKRYASEHPNTTARPEVMLFDVETAEGLEGFNAFARQAEALDLPCCARFSFQAALKMAASAGGEMAGIILNPALLSEGDALAFRDLAAGLQRAGKSLLLQCGLPQGQEAGQALATLDQALTLAEAAGLKDILVAAGATGASQAIHAYRALASFLDQRAHNHPLLLAVAAQGGALMEFSIGLGSLLCDGVGDAILIEAGDARLDAVSLGFNILQAAQVRISKTDFVSCPSCGRTLFDLQEVTARIKKRTSHLTGVKIAIMGCIVNGPGEMADADFGYVGGVPGKVNLFVGKECVQRHIPFDQADDALVELIKKQGKWSEPL